ncbi:hypothetical protein J6590_031900 [Homalodisca vitripennis]|nr:hypothetical protein J6590_031900 [Homalodisca vitripennis]
MLNCESCCTVSHVALSHAVNVNHVVHVSHALNVNYAVHVSHALNMNHAVHISVLMAAVLRDHTRHILILLSSLIKSVLDVLDATSPYTEASVVFTSQL